MRGYQDCAQISWHVSYSWGKLQRISARRPFDECCATSHCLKWGPLPQTEVGRIAQHGREGEGRNEVKGGVERYHYSRVCVQEKMSFLCFILFMSFLKMWILYAMLNCSFFMFHINLLECFYIMNCLQGFLYILLQFFVFFSISMSRSHCLIIGWYRCFAASVIRYTNKYIWTV